jgi:hypothetical protein
MNDPNSSPVSVCDQVEKKGPISDGARAQQIVERRVVLAARSRHNGRCYAARSRRSDRRGITLVCPEDRRRDGESPKPLRAGLTSPFTDTAVAESLLIPRHALGETRPTHGLLRGLHAVVSEWRSNSGAGDYTNSREVNRCFESIKRRGSMRPVERAGSMGYSEAEAAVRPQRESLARRQRREEGRTPDRSEAALERRNGRSSTGRPNHAPTATDCEHGRISTSRSSRATRLAGRASTAHRA